MNPNEKAALEPLSKSPAATPGKAGASLIFCWPGGMPGNVADSISRQHGVLTKPSRPTWLLFLV